MKKIFLAGATGSIGKNVFYCLGAINRYYQENHKPNECFHLAGIAIRKNIKGLLASLKNLNKQGNTLPPEVIVSTDPKTVDELKKNFPNAKIFSSIREAADFADYDIMVNALSGSIGIHATMAAAQRKKKILLANKESLVMAGTMLNRLIKKNRTELVPIDSEHSALSQLIRHYHPKEVGRLILTASGGPFYKNNKKNPTIAEALNHPRWKMGKKISIDSATMMNKGLEVIETHHLFGFPYQQIEVIIHPQSLAHSLIETIDGVQYAQLGSTDMRHPIFSALSHPELIPHRLKKFNLFDYGSLNFEKPDFKQFPMLKLAYDCGQKELQGGHYCAVMNAANEEAVHLFLQGKIAFPQIYSLTASMVERYGAKRIDRHNTIEGIIELDLETKIKTKEASKAGI